MSKHCIFQYTDACAEYHMYEKTEFSFSFKWKYPYLVASTQAFVQNVEKVCVYEESLSPAKKIPTNLKQTRYGQIIHESVLDQNCKFELNKHSVLRMSLVPPYLLVFRRKDLCEAKPNVECSKKCSKYYAQLERPFTARSISSFLCSR